MATADPETPSRSRQSHPFPASSQSSPVRPSTSSVSSVPLSSELLLNIHAAASDPKLAALEQAITERNSLSSQNSQLWKLIEKQRAGYNQILKELDRIRSERDTYKAKLGIGNSFVKRDRPKKQQSDDIVLTPKVSLVAPPRSDSLPAMVQSPVNRQTDVPLINTPIITRSPYPNSSHNAETTSSLESKATFDQYSFQEPRKPTSSVPSVALLPIPDRSVSRDSRVSLPDEARRYIASMPDPIDTSAPLPMERSSVSVSVSLNQPRQTECLEMDEEDEERESNPAFASSEREGHEPLIAKGILDADLEQPPRPMTSSDPPLPPLNQSDSRKDIAYAAVDEFPLPPSNLRLQTQYMTGNQSRSPQNSKNHEVIESPQQHYDQTGDANGPLPKSQQVTTHFRALPLLSTDLPTTTINVSHSYIRPNDKGKEVLSFIVFVSPGNGKPGWKVEKMYSDVLSLDQRVKQSVGKGIGKKINSLPEGKLWKDHAPAKVDQRKAVLEQYLQTLINLPVRNNDEVIAFFTTDIVRETKQPVMQAGYKEGYLTKRGKNFGGWKARFFVLQGPVLEYYDCRGGTHLGSITITGAQIGRQQRTDRAGVDDDKEYRHAFLIVEAKKGPGGHHPRHVLCAESDEERDSWVEMLVRYFTGTYSEDPILMTVGSSGQASSCSVDNSSDFGDRNKGPTRSLSRDDLSVTKNTTNPVSQLALDATKIFQASPFNVDDSTTARSSSPTKSIDYSPSERDEIQTQNSNETPTFNGFGASETSIGLPSSLPEQSMLSLVSTPTAFLDSATNTAASLAPRANSELGHYPDLPTSNAMTNKKSPRRASPEIHRTSTRDQDCKSFYPSSTAPSHSHSDRVPSPDKVDSSGRVKISAPMNGAPIPSGFKFGGHTEANPSPSDRREKAKSRLFWGFGKTNGDKQVVANIPRAVFGVPLEESLEVAQICNLPAIVFRAIQYLEAKKADQEEGIYRLSGSSAVIKSLKDRFNSDGDVDLLASDEYWDPHAIAGLLKSYLRELPASILTRELHLKFLAVIDFVDPQERITELSQLIATLPLPNYTLLRALTAHLILIVQNCAVNKMTMRNVGIVFSPTLGIPAGVFSLMLGEFNRVFNVDADISDTGGVDGSSDLYRRNSRRYSEAAADQLLGLSGRRLTVANDSHSDGDDLVQDGESEITDGDATVESFSSSIATTQADQPDTPAKHNVSKASRAASSRALQVTITQSERGNRYSRMMGLPASPRPLHSPHHIADGLQPKKGSS